MSDDMGDIPSTDIPFSIIDMFINPNICEICKKEINLDLFPLGFDLIFYEKIKCYINLGGESFTGVSTKKNELKICDSCRERISNSINAEIKKNKKKIKGS